MGKCGNDSVRIKENMDRNPVYSTYFMECLAEHFCQNLDLRENENFVSARKLFVPEYVNCLTVRK